MVKAGRAGGLEGWRAGGLESWRSSGGLMIHGDASAMGGVLGARGRTIYG